MNERQERLNSFPKSLRLLKRRDFLRVQGHRAFYKCPFFVLLRAPSENPAPRFGFTVKKKIGNAVVRNRVRRLFREVVRKNRLAFSSGDYVFIAGRMAHTAKYSEIEREVGQALRKS